MHYDVFDLVVNGVAYRLPIDPNHERSRLFRQYFEKNGNYEAVMVALLARLLAALQQPVFFDIGAFIGYYTCYVAKLLGPNHKVYAIESNPLHGQLIREAIRLNGFTQVELIEAALSDRVESVRAVDNAIVVGGDQGVALTSVRLDDLCRARDLRPNIAKMDVHGFEGKILRGMPDTLRGDLQYLLLELHPNVYLDRYTPGITRMQILDYLEDAGFINYYVAGHRYTWSDGMRRFFDTGHFAYERLSRDRRGTLLFDRHNQIFVVSSKTPLEELVGPSTIDPSVE